MGGGPQKPHPEEPHFQIPSEHFLGIKLVKKPAFTVADSPPFRSARGQLQCGFLLLSQQKKGVLIRVLLLLQQDGQLREHLKSGPCLQKDIRGEDHHDGGQDLGSRKAYRKSDLLLRLHPREAPEADAALRKNGERHPRVKPSVRGQGTIETSLGAGRAVEAGERNPERIHSGVSAGQQKPEVGVLSEQEVAEHEKPAVVLKQGVQADVHIPGREGPAEGAKRFHLNMQASPLPPRRGPGGDCRQLLGPAHRHRQEGGVFSRAHGLHSGAGREMHLKEGQRLPVG